MSKSADICLLLEGTYPFVRGGVSSWIHQMITGLNQFSFHIIFLGGHPDFYDKPAYKFPKNVTGFEIHYLLSDQEYSKPSPRSGNEEVFKLWNSFLVFFEQNKKPIPAKLLGTISDILADEKKLGLANFLYSEASWNVLVKRYLESADQQSFIDYFWTYRNIYQPLFVMSKALQNLPDVKTFHSISTGYAGFFGAMCQQKTSKPYLLTEHGIYTKERKIDLSQASWIKDRHNIVDLSMHKDMDLTRKTWIRFFEQLGLTAYSNADKIIALFEGNRQRQHLDGASDKKTAVIVNGINTQNFLTAYKKRPKTPPKIVGLVGRVVPIKDTKTFIRTIRGVVEKIPELEGWIIGPTEEDKTYVDECLSLIESLGLTDNIKILGNQNIVEILPKIGVLMLTSISEAQPLVLLEAMAAGIPCISTDVGACREIIEGASGEDAEIGSAGEIIPISSPLKGAEAIIKIFQNEKKWCDIGDIGKTRVKKYYDEKLMFQSYQNLYEEAISGGDRL